MSIDTSPPGVDSPPDSSQTEEAPSRTRAKTVVAYLIAAIVVVSLDALVLLALGADPTVALPEIVRSSLGGVREISQTIERTVPLMLGSCAVVFAMRVGLINLGVDGQIQSGAIAATAVAFAFPDLGAFVLIPFVLTAGAFGGAVLAAPPALLRARLGVNELFSTVMLNFVALLAVEYLTTGPWTDEATGEAISTPVSSSARLGDLFDGGTHRGVLVALVLALGLALLLHRTRLGFTLRATGSNELAARYGGIDTARSTVIALVVSGAAAGVAGAIEVAGVHGRLILGMATNFGYLSVLVAVLARRSLVGIVPISLAFGALIVGSDSLQRSVNLPASTTLVFQAVTVITVLCAEQILQKRRSN